MHFEGSNNTTRQKLNKMEQKPEITLDQKFDDLKERVDNLYSIAINLTKVVEKGFSDIYNYLETHESKIDKIQLDVKSLKGGSETLHTNIKEVKESLTGQLDEVLGELSKINKATGYQEMLANENTVKAIKA